MLTGIANTSSTTSTSNSASSATAKVEEQQDRFLKLLVAQLNNQDPMNPLDNAQMTSQMAQINTVTGIEKVNETLKSMAAQFSALQVMQGSNLVGHQVLVDDSTLSIENGVASGAIDLAGRAESVRVDILSPAGAVIDSVNLGALDAGRQHFSWDASSYSFSGNPSFKVTATLGGQAISSTALARSSVTSVGSENDALSIQLSNGKSVAYDSIKAIL